MTRRALLPFIMLPLTLCSIVAHAVRFMVETIDQLFASPRFLVDQGVFMPLSPAYGAPIDPSLQHGLRHEAHVSRRSAARNT